LKVDNLREASLESNSDLKKKRKKKRKKKKEKQDGRK
jgi:hypothetical protein